MDRINHIHQNLFIGGTPGTCRHVARDVALLRGDGAEAEGLPRVNLIIDCRSPEEVEDNKAWAEFPDMPPVVYTGMHDNGYDENDASMLLQAGAALVRRANELGIPPEQLGVFVHCHMGINRAPSTAMYLFMRFHGMTPREAFEKIREKRVGARVHYASLAVSAFLGEAPDAKDVLRSWKSFERRYWDRDRKEEIHRTIYHMHLRAQGRIIEDADGQLHGVGV